MDHSHLIAHLKNMKMVLEILQGNFGMACVTSTASQPRDTLIFALISSMRMAPLVTWNTLTSTLVPRNQVMDQPTLDFLDLLQELGPVLQQVTAIPPNGFFMYNPYQVLPGPTRLATMSAGGGTAMFLETPMDREEVGMKQPTHNGMECLFHKLRSKYVLKLVLTLHIISASCTRIICRLS